MKKDRAEGIITSLREYIFDAMDIEVDDHEREHITVENRSNHANGVVVVREVVVKIKIDQR